MLFNAVGVGIECLEQKRRNQFSSQLQIFNSPAFSCMKSRKVANNQVGFVRAWRPAYEKSELRVLRAQETAEAF